MVGWVVMPVVKLRSTRLGSRFERDDDEGSLEEIELEILGRTIQNSITHTGLQLRSPACPGVRDLR